MGKEEAWSRFNFLVLKLLSITLVQQLSAHKLLRESGLLLQMALIMMLSAHTIVIYNQRALLLPFLEEVWRLVLLYELVLLLRDQELWLSRVGVPSALVDH